MMIAIFDKNVEKRPMVTCIGSVRSLNMLNTVGCLLIGQLLFAFTYSSTQAYPFTIYRGQSFDLPDYDVQQQQHQPQPLHFDKRQSAGSAGLRNCFFSPIQCMLPLDASRRFYQK